MIKKAIGEILLLLEEKVENELKKEIIDTVAKKHHIIIDENDPIFAIITANEISFTKYIKEIENSNSIYLVELETKYQKIVDEVKELAEKRISVAVENVKNDLEATRRKILEKINSALTINYKEAPKEKNKFNFMYIIGFILFFLIGLNIGVFIK